MHTREGESPRCNVPLDLIGLSRGIGGIGWVPVVAVRSWRTEEAVVANIGGFVEGQDNPGRVETARRRVQDLLRTAGKRHFARQRTLSDYGLVGPVEIHTPVILVEWYGHRDCYFKRKFRDYGRRDIDGRILHSGSIEQFFCGTAHILRTRARDHPHSGAIVGCIFRCVRESIHASDFDAAPKKGKRHG